MKKRTLADAIRENNAVRNGAASPARPANPEKGVAEKARKSAATRLVELAEAAGIELYHTSDPIAFADLYIDGRRETMALRSAVFKRWLHRLFFMAEGRAAGSQAVQDGLGVLEGKACFEGVERAVHVRLAEQDGRIYFDLADRK
jgi:hypothetical protein